MQLAAPVLKIGKRWISKIGIVLGFMAATAVGIIGGIDAALMFPSIQLPIGLIMGGSSCFVNAVSYFYVVSKVDSAGNVFQPKVIQRNTASSTAFALAATFFIGTTFIANFVGMYIGFTVLGGKLDLNWPEIALQIPGAAFGVSSAVSGLIFNIQVAHTLWNRIRQTAINSLSANARPLLIDINDSGDKDYSSTAILRDRLIHQVDPEIDNTSLMIQDDSDSPKDKLKSRIKTIEPSFFIQRHQQLTLPATAFDNTDYLSRHKRSNSL